MGHLKLSDKRCVYIKPAHVPSGNLVNKRMNG